MAYNNYYPVSYQPLYPYYPTQQPVQQPQQINTQQPVSSGIIWVQGEAGAKSYLVAPNTTVQLWDSEKQTIYIKSADAAGMPSIKTLDYTIRDAALNSGAGAGSNGFATKDEVTALSARLDALRGEIDTLTKGRETANE